MNILELKNYSEKIQRLGRTYEGPNGEIYMNWTCSGIKFCFTGTCLIAELGGIYEEEMDLEPLNNTYIKRKTWPYAAVFIDDLQEPIRYFEVKDPTNQYLLFCSEEIETHTITIRKMTENAKGKISIGKLLVEGSIGEDKRKIDEKTGEYENKIKLEFIGDSITCGFGNLSGERDRLFFSMDEDGWLSHAAIAARKLQADFNIISYSGIAVTKGLEKSKWQIPSMTDLYPYTDLLMEEKLGEKENFQKWNFNSFKPDVIVLNLGTNDATVIDFNEDTLKGIQLFEEDYYHFLKVIRENNGRDPWIICALGSMDYFLFDNIKKAVERFSTDAEDSKIRCFKYGRIRLKDGFGACGHPSELTQRRMGEEIADYINELIKQ